MDVIKDDQELMNRFLSGDEIAFREVFDNFYQDLCYFTTKFTGDADEGERIVADCFEVLFRKYKDFNTLVNIRAFLYISARNRCLNYLKSRQRLRKKEKEYRYQNKEQFIEIEIIDANVIKAIHAAVEELPAQCARIVKMLYLEEKKYSEVASALGIAESTVRSQNRRALQLLRQRLGHAQFKLLPMLAYGVFFQYILLASMEGK